MSQGDWREQWDAHASGEVKKYMDMPLDELMANLKTGKFGGYHTIWSIIAKRATLEQVGWELYAILESDREYLDRYHCAKALLEIMKSNAFQPVELSAKRGEQLSVNLKKLKQMLEQKIGLPPHRS